MVRGNRIQSLTSPSDLPEMPSVIGFDVETNVTEFIKGRKLYVVTLGNTEWQWVVDWLRCPAWCREKVKSILNSSNIQKVGHNLSFDINTMWTVGYPVVNIWDTMICEVVLNNGLLNKYPSLAELVEQRLFRFMDKSIRTSYNGEQLSDDQIWYAAKDVRYLIPIRRLQYLDLHREKLTFTAALEFEFTPVLARMEYDGVKLDPDRWREALEWAEENYEKARTHLQETVEDDPRLLDHMIKTNKIIVEDKIVVNWNSPAQKMLIAQHFFSPMTGLSKPMLKRAYAQAQQAVAEDQDVQQYADMFLDALNDNWDKMQEYIIREDKQWLINQGMLIPAGTCLINWNSAPQMKEIGLLIAPQLKSMEARYIKNRDHPFFKALVSYNEWQKRVGTYGASFLDHIQPDGRVHTRWVQIVDTGRTASQRPNMQNIPAKGDVGNRYRRAFIPENGNLLYGSDFSGQEAVLAAYVYKEPAWLNALKQGHDLHSTVAELVFDQRWKQSAEPDCAYFTQGKQKCNCKPHKKLRDQVKTINFG